MDGQEYLNQISASTRPAQKPKDKSSLLSSKFFLVGAIGVGVLILIIIIGAVLGGGNKGGEKSLGAALLLHLNNTAEEIDEFQSSVKSSDLRSSSASLKGILSNTSSELEAYLTEKYNLKEKDVDKKTASAADDDKNELHDILFEAKINGNLDRIYAHEMAYEITMIKAEEDKLADTTKSDELRDMLKTSSTSLDNLYTKFNDFSEAK